MSLKEVESEDVRIDYIGHITKVVLPIEPNLWDEFMWKEDNQLIMKDFLDTPATRLLLIYVDMKSKKLTATTEFPTQRPFSNICFYFLKYSDIAIPMSNFRLHFMHGTLSNLPLKQYQAVYEQVMVPILCNPNNNTKWPADVVKDIELHVQDFRKTLSYCLGQANGKTVLPIPHMARQVDLLDLETINSESISDVNIRKILDSIGDMVTDWTLLISEILNAGSRTDPLSTMNNEGPLTEVVFWQDRKDNLEFIFSQINEPVIKKMALVLEKTNSCYRQSFVKLLRDVVEVLAEAEDIASNLQSLIEPFQQLYNCSFPEMAELLPKIMDTATVSWTTSKYFSSVPSRIGVLIKKICNQLIKKAQEFLDGPKLFQKERSVREKDTKLTKKILDIFVESYYKNRELESTFEHAKLYPWEFPDERVFSRLKAFIQRLEDLQELFLAANTYNQISQYKIMELQLMELTVRMNKVFGEFFELYKVFEESKYDVLDIDNKMFGDHFSQFQQKMSDLDSRLGASIGQSCIKITPTEEAFKLITKFSSIIQRPLVEVEFKKCVPHVIDNLKDELLLAREMYDNNMKCIEENGQCIVYRKLPSLPGSLQWASDLKKKMSSPVNSLRNIKQYFRTEKDADLVYQMFNELVELLTKFEKDSFGRWTDQIDDLIKEKLEQHVLMKDSNERFSVNYDLLISEMIEEITILGKTHKAIPVKAISLIDNKDALRYSRSVLLTSVRYYNTLCDELVPFEKTLVSREWDEINVFLVQGLGMMWNTSGLDQYAETLYKAVHSVYKNVNMTKENIQEVQDMINVWKEKPMYERESSQALVDLQIYMTDFVKEQYDNVKKTALKMEEKMKENLKLFKCDAESEEWNLYVKYLETIIEDGLKDAAACSLSYLCKNTDGANTKLVPFTKIKLELDLEDGLTFTPPIMSKQPGSLLSCFEAAIDKIYAMGQQATRMTDQAATYEKVLKQCDTLTPLKNTIVQHIIQGTSKVKTAVSAVERYEDLWMVDIEDSLEDFIMFGPAPEMESENEEEELEDEEDEDRPLAAPLDMKPPTEEEFREEIAKFELLYRKADDIQPIITVESWLIVDMTAFKDDLLSLMRQWIAAYKQKLIEQKSLGLLRTIVKEEID